MSLFNTNTEIKKTKNYNAFKSLQGNRDVNLARVVKLKQSMSEKLLLSPIIVNEKMEIIDGQHRFLAFKDLNLLVPYVVQKGLKTQDAIRYNNNSRNWGSKDYIQAQLNLKNQEYEILNDFMKRYKFSATFAINLLAGTSPNTKASMDSFKEGTFKVVNLKSSVVYAENIQKLKPYHNIRRVYFLKAMYMLHNNRNFKFERFLKKLSLVGVRFIECPTVKEYLKLIEELYNYKVYEQNRVRLY